MERDIDVKQIRKDRLANIEAQIDRAFKHRKRVNYLPETGTTAEALERAEKTRVMFEDKVQKALDHGFKGSIDDIEVVIKGEGEDEPHEVSVEHSHEYQDLLAAAIRKLVKEGFYVPQKGTTTGSLVEEILEHEYAHQTPLLGNKGLHVRYSVRFEEDRANKLVLFTPSISYTGRIKIGVDRDSLSAPKRLSKSDKKEALR